MGHQFQLPGSNSWLDQQLLHTFLLIILVIPSNGSKSTSVKPEIITVGVPYAQDNQLNPLLIPINNSDSCKTFMISVSLLLGCTVIPLGCLFPM